MTIQTFDPIAGGVALQGIVAERGSGPHKEDTLKGVAPAVEASGQSLEQGQTSSQTAAGAVPDKKNVEELARSVQEYFQGKGVNLHFKVLEDSNQVQVEMLDEDSKKVIRKFPQDEMIKLADNMKRLAKGVLDRAV